MLKFNICKLQSVAVHVNIVIQGKMYTKSDESNFIIVSSYIILLLFYDYFILFY